MSVPSESTSIEWRMRARRVRMHVAYGGAQIRVAVEKPPRKEGLKTCLHAQAAEHVFAELDGIVLDETALRDALADVAQRAAGPGGGAYR